MSGQNLSDNGVSSLMNNLGSTCLGKDCNFVLEFKSIAGNVSGTPKILEGILKMRVLKWGGLLLILPCWVSVTTAEPAASGVAESTVSGVSVSAASGVAESAASGVAESAASGVSAPQRSIYPLPETPASAVGSAPTPEEDYQAGIKADTAGNLVDAGRLFMRAAKAGHAGAQAYVALGLRTGSSDLAAFEFFRKSAEQGNILGQMGLGTMYAESGVVPQDFGEARKWYGRAADQGDKQAIHLMAEAYINGRLGLDEAARNSPEALDWIKRAVAVDDATASRALAKAYRSGQFGLAVDTKQADDLDAKADKLLGKEEKKTKKKR